MEKVIKKSENKIIAPKMFRREIRSIKKARRGFEFTNKRKPVGSSHFNLIGITVWNPQAIYIPKRKKLKGWQKSKS